MTDFHGFSRISNEVYKLENRDPVTGYQENGAVGATKEAAAWK